MFSFSLITWRGSLSPIISELFGCGYPIFSTGKEAKLFSVITICQTLNLFNFVWVRLSSPFVWGTEVKYFVLSVVYLPLQILRLRLRLTMRCLWTCFFSVLFYCIPATMKRWRFTFQLRKKKIGITNKWHENNRKLQKV